MSDTFLQLLTAQESEGGTVSRILQQHHQQTLATGLEWAQILVEQHAPDRFAVLSGWSSQRESEEARLGLTLALADLLVYEPAIYRLRPLRVVPPDGRPYSFVGASLTFAPEALAGAVESMALAEGERLMEQPGFIWTRRLRSISGPAVVFTCSGWSDREAYDRAQQVVMDLVEDRIDLLGCHQVFLSLVPRWDSLTPTAAR